MLQETYTKLEKIENVEFYYIRLWSWVTGDYKKVIRFNADFKRYAFSNFCDLINAGYTVDLVAVTRKDEKIVLNPIK